MLFAAGSPDSMNGSSSANFDRSAHSARHSINLVQRGHDRLSKPTQALATAALDQPEVSLVHQAGRVERLPGLLPRASA
jgi:hypothetical protein